MAMSRFTSIRSSKRFILVTVGIAMFTDMFLFALVVPILPFILEKQVGMPASQTQASISTLLTSYFASSIVVAPLFGWLGDRVRSRRTLYLIGIALLGVATAILFTVRSYPLLVISRVMQGASASLVWITGMALCSDTVGVENLGAALSTITGFVVFGALFAPVFGGSIYHIGGISAVALTAAAVLIVDFVMRLLVIETNAPIVPVAEHERLDSNAAPQTNEGEPLLAAQSDTTTTSGPSPYRLSPSSSSILNKIPVVQTFRSSSMLSAQLIVLAEGIFFSSFDASIPLHVQRRFGFNALQSGFMLVPVGLITAIFGPLAGMGVDRFGSKILAAAGFAVTAVGMGLISAHFDVPGGDEGQIALYATFLGICGLGLAMLDSPAFVESALVVERYFKANPEVFQGRSQSASMSAINFIFFSIGMAVGPTLVGIIVGDGGYRKLALAQSILSAVMAIVSFMLLGGPPTLNIHKRKHDDMNDSDM